ncbi:MAG: hypothetical protein ACRD2G_07260 [Terriglobia bacterium]
MGRNKDLRKAIAGHERNIGKHKLKIESESEKDFPNEELIEKWRQDIKKSELRIQVLRRRLEGRRNHASR